MKRHSIYAAIALACAAATPGAIADTGTSAAAGTYATTQSEADLRSSKLVGTKVYNSANESVGEINDLIIGSSGGVSSAVIGVGGFLGIGEKNVAVPFSSLKVSRVESGSMKITIDANKEALKAAPEFKYLNTKS